MDRKKLGQKWTKTRPNMKQKEQPKRTENIPNIDQK